MRLLSALLGEDSALLQLCALYGALVLLRQLVLPALGVRLELALPRLRLAPVLPAREFRQRKHALERRIHEVGRELEAERRLRTKRRRSRSRNGRSQNRETSRTERSAMKGSTSHGRRPHETASADFQNHGLRVSKPRKPVVLVDPVDSPVILRRAAPASLQDQGSQRLVYWESPADLFRRDESLSKPVFVARNAVVDRDADELVTRGAPNGIKLAPRLPTRDEADDASNTKKAEYPPAETNRSVRLGMPDFESAGTSIASLIGITRQATSRQTLSSTSTDQLSLPRHQLHQPTAQAGFASTRARLQHSAPVEPVEEAKQESDDVEVIRARYERRMAQQKASDSAIQRLRHKWGAKRSHEQAFPLPSNRPQERPVEATTSKTPRIIRRIAFEDDEGIQSDATPAWRRPRGKKRAVSTDVMASSSNLEPLRQRHRST